MTDGGGASDGNDDDEVMTFTCPTCKAKAKVKVKDAERTHEARCPKGHVIPLARGI